MTRIYLIHTPSGWEADHVGERAEEIRSLFGTTRIPTSFTARADAETVRSAIQRLNPGDLVTVAP